MTKRPIVYVDLGEVGADIGDLVHIRQGLASVSHFCYFVIVVITSVDVFLLGANRMHP